MSRSPRHLSLSEAEDAALRDLEITPGIHPKVRLRSSVLRLSAQGWTIPRLARHFARSSAAIHHDLDRYEQRGLSALGDDAAPGNSALITPEMQTFLHLKLAEDRLWNCTLLGEALSEQFGIHPGREAVRLSLLSLGYSWKRSRYAPGKTVDPAVMHEHQASLETFKRGHWRES